MNNLFLCTLILGLVALCCHMVLLLMPDRVKPAALAFPRHVWAGRVLSSIALAWAAYETYAHMPLGGLEGYKIHLVWITPLLIGLSWTCLDELLAPRALGALLLLYPAPLLRGVRVAMGPTPAAVIMSYVGYLVALKGAVLFLSPYVFRRGVTWLYARPRVIRPLAAAGVVFDLALIVLALVVYR